MSDAEPTASTRRPAGVSVRAWSTFLSVCLLSLAADLWIKAAAFVRVAGRPIDMSLVREHGDHAIPRHGGVPLLPGLLELRLTVNPGAIFGLGAGQAWFFALVSLVAVGVILRVFWLSHASARLSHLGLALVLAGALGNLYDRIRFGVVRDMFFLFPDLRLPFGWRWPNGSSLLYPWIFNLADVLLLIGVTVLLITMWRRDKPTQASRKAHD